MKHLCEFKRCPKDDGRSSGFIVDISDTLILLHTLEWDTFRLNGYTVLRSADISQYRFFDRTEYWQFRSARRFRLRPVSPAGISIESLPDLLSSAGKRYSLLTIHREKRMPDVCFIGRLASMTQQTFTIDDLDCNGEWSGLRRMKFSDVTRVDFGGGYERALAATAPKTRKREN